MAISPNREKKPKEKVTNNVAAARRRDIRNAKRLPGEGEVRCKGCTEIFTPRRKTHVFHSTDCKNAWHNAQVLRAHNGAICEYCQSPFVQERKDQRYCKPACRLAVYSESRLVATILVPYALLDNGLCGTIMVTFDNGKVTEISPEKALTSGAIESSIGM